MAAIAEKGNSGAFILVPKPGNSFSRGNIVISLIKLVRTVVEFIIHVWELLDFLEVNFGGQERANFGTSNTAAVEIVVPERREQIRRRLTSFLRGEEARNWIRNNGDSQKEKIVSKIREIVYFVRAARWWSVASGSLSYV